jgi:protein-tyrosine-phosphatase
MHRVLILTNKNSARSQMLEGWLGYYTRGEAYIYSAGLEASEFDPFAVKAMIEAVVDIRTAKCKVIDLSKSEDYDFVITLTVEATKLANGSFPNSKIIERLFDDPKLAEGDETARLKVYRKMVDEIDDFAMEFALGELGVKL